MDRISRGSSYLTALLYKSVNEILAPKFLARCLALSKCSVNAPCWRPAFLYMSVSVRRSICMSPSSQINIHVSVSINISICKSIYLKLI